MRIIRQAPRARSYEKHIGFGLILSCVSFATVYSSPARMGTAPMTLAIAFNLSFALLEKRLILILLLIIQYISETTETLGSPHLPFGNHSTKFSLIAITDYAFFPNFTFELLYVVRHNLFTPVYFIFLKVSFTTITT